MNPPPLPFRPVPPLPLDLAGENLRLIDEALEHFPEEVPLHLARVEMLEEFKRLEEAELACVPGVFGSRQPKELRFKFAMLQSLKGNKQRCLELLEELYRDEPDYEEVIGELCYSLRDNGQYERALSLARKMVEMDGNLFSNHLTVFIMAFPMGLNREALAAALKAYELEPSAPRPALGVVEVLTGTELKDPKRARRFFESARGNFRKGLQLSHMGCLVSQCDGNEGELLAHLAPIVSDPGDEAYKVLRKLLQLDLPKRVLRHAIEMVEQGTAGNLAILPAWIDQRCIIQAAEVEFSAALRLPIHPALRTEALRQVIGKICLGAGVRKDSLLALLRHHGHTIQSNSTWWGEMCYCIVGCDMNHLMREWTLEHKKLHPKREDWMLLYMAAGLSYQHGLRSAKEVWQELLEPREGRNEKNEALAVLGYLAALDGNDEESVSLLNRVKPLGMEFVGEITYPAARYLLEARRAGRNPNEEAWLRCEAILVELEGQGPFPHKGALLAPLLDQLQGELLPIPDRLRRLAASPPPAKKGWLSRLLS
jgi:tetratricopeptide (TPR) repeat protein